MRKGFSLVELSIVLVIIGVLMGMVVKGRQLVESARYRAEVTKMLKMKIRFAEYVAENNGKMPPKASSTPGSWSGYDIRVFGDLPSTSIITSSSGKPMLFGFARFVETSTGFYGHSWSNKESFTGITVGNIEQTDGFHPKETNYRIICKLDRIIDDGVAITGRFRPYGQQDEYNTNTDCTKYSSGYWVKLGYRIDI